NGAAPVLLGRLVEAADGTRGHVGGSVQLMIVRRPTAVGRRYDGAHVVAGALEQHDGQPDHLGMAQHVAPEPKRDAVGAYSHLSSSSSVSCSRAKILTRGNKVGSCLAGICCVSLSARCLAMRTNSIASSPASCCGHAATHNPVLAQALPQAIVSEGAISPLASRRNPSVTNLASAAGKPM